MPAVNPQSGEGGGDSRWEPEPVVNGEGDRAENQTGSALLQR